MRPHIAYSLLLAISHIEQPSESFGEHFASPAVKRIEGDHVIPNLLRLEEVLSSDNASPQRLRAFYAACSGRTNVGDQRITRFKWFCKALAEPKL